jgi:hypothetical protein
MLMTSAHSRPSFGVTKRASAAPAEVSTRGGAEPHRESPRVSIVVYSAQTRDVNGTKHGLVAKPGATSSL